MRYFKVAKGFEDNEVSLPKRSTQYSAGYDFQAVEDVVVPSVWKTFLDRMDKAETKDAVLTPQENRGGFKPTLIPTGVKANMPGNEYLELANRSSNPKKGLVLANGVGVIDKDYFENPDNDGHIMFQFLNFSEQDYLIKKHDKIGQGIFKEYKLTEDDDAQGTRNGGFGSTGA